MLLLDTLTTPLSDHKLPTLPTALSDQRMGRVLSQQTAMLQTLGLSKPVGVRHQLLKHTPGQRCVIAYHLNDGPGQDGPVVIGKLYPKNRGERIFELTRTLWEANRRLDKTPCSMAEPLQYVPELGLILHRQVSGKPLNKLLRSPHIIDYLRAVAKNLAALHSTPVPGLESRNMVNHLSKYCHPGPGHLGLSFAGIRRNLEEILHIILDTETLQNIPLCTVHGDLGLHQIYLHRGRAHFIDFDNLCLSNAALDLANFQVALKIYLGKQGEMLSQQFMAAYLAEKQEASVEGLDVYQAFTYLRWATICYRHQAEPNWPEKVRWLIDCAIGALQEAEDWR